MSARTVGLAEPLGNTTDLGLTGALVARQQVLHVVQAPTPARMASRGFSNTRIVQVPLRQHSLATSFSVCSGNQLVKGQEQALAPLCFGPLAWLARPPGCGTPRGSMVWVLCRQVVVIKDGHSDADIPTAVQSCCVRVGWFADLAQSAKCYSP